MKIKLNSYSANNFLSSRLAICSTKQVSFYATDRQANLLNLAVQYFTCIIGGNPCFKFAFRGKTPELSTVISFWAKLCKVSKEMCFCSKDHADNCKKKPVECPNGCGELIVVEEVGA